MMYNGLMKFIARAQEEIRSKSLEAAHNTLIRCQDIVFEFQYTLNMDYAVSNNLMLLYDYLYNRLIEANAKKDCDILDEVLGFVTELRDTWVEAVKLNKEQKAEAAEAEDAEQAEAEQAGANAAKDNAAAAGAGAQAAAAQANAAQANAAQINSAQVNSAGLAQQASQSEPVQTAAPTEVEVPGASVRIGAAIPAIPRNKAIYTRGATPMTPMAPAVKTPAPAAAPAIANERQPQLPAATPMASIKPPPASVSTPAAAMAFNASNPVARNITIQQNGDPAPEKPELAKGAPPLANKGLGNNVAAAQYAKVSKAKNPIQEAISLASK